MGRNTRKRISRQALIGSVIAVPWLWLCWRYWHFFPLWDAAIYYQDALTAAEQTLNPLAYNIARHPTMGYLYLPAAATRIFGKSYRIFLVYNALLGWGMSIAIADIAARLLRNEYRRLDLLLVVGSAMYCPVVVASTLQLTPDFGVLVFLTLSVWALTRERFVQASVWGILAGLSKESGVLLFVAEVLCYLWVYGLRAPKHAHEKVITTIRRVPLLITTAVAPMLIKAFEAVEENQLLVHGGGVEGLVRQFLSISFLDNLLPASLATILVLNCMWIPASLLLLALGIGGVRKLLLASSVHVRRAPIVEFVMLLCIVELFLLTRFRTFTNVRYYLPLFPWLILMAARVMLNLNWPRGLRLSVQAITLMAFSCSSFRSFDPVSTRVFGKIPFGDHQLFHVTSLTHECCGLGRDQLVYNLEFAELDQILRDVLPWVLDSRSHTMALHPLADWFVFRTIDPLTKRRSAPSPNSMHLPYVYFGAFAPGHRGPDKIYYIALPNMPNSEELARYGADYSIVSTRRFRHGGYYIDVVELARKV